MATDKSGQSALVPLLSTFINDEAETKNDCPSDDAWWHFVLAPNNGQYAFTSMNLNIGGSTTLISGADIVANGGQTDNVFVAVPEGASLDDLSAAGSSAMVDPYSTKVKFVLSHVCEGDEVIVEEPVAEEEVTEDEVTVADEPAVEDDAPVSDDENSEEETAEEDGADDPIKDTNNDTNDNEQDNPITEIVTPDPEEQDLDETPNDVTNDIEVNSNDSVVEAASIVETTPDTEVAPSLNVTADDTDHNALPATGMELSLAFLGLGLAGIGGTLLAVRRRLMIK